MTAMLEMSLSQISFASTKLSEASDECPEKSLSWIPRLIAGIYTSPPGRNRPILVEGEVSEPFDDIGDYVEVTYTYRLGYGQNDGEWGLFVSRASDRKWDETTCGLLRCAPRGVRMADLDRIAELLQCLTKQLIATTHEVLKKTAVAKEVGRHPEKYAPWLLASICRRRTEGVFTAPMGIIELR